MEIIIVYLYVDDIIYIKNSMSLLKEFKKCMMSEFEMTDLEFLHYFLGMEIIQNSNGIFLCQEKYAKDLLKRFHMSTCKPVNTSINSNNKLVFDDDVEKIDKNNTEV